MSTDDEVVFDAKFATCLQRLDAMTDAARGVDNRLCTAATELFFALNASELDNSPAWQRACEALLGEWQAPADDEAVES